MSLIERLTRPLWKEDPGYRKRRRLRQMLMVPAMAFGGLLWGLLSAPSDAAAPGWALGGALAFGSAAWLYLHLQPALLHWCEMKVGRGGRLLGALLDWSLVGGTVWLVTEVLGMPTHTSVSAAIGIGGAYAAVVAGFWDEAGTRLISGVLPSALGGSGRVAPPFSHIQSLLARGDLEGAEEALRLFVEDHPSDPRGWLALAQVVATGAGDDPGPGSEQAVELLRAGMDAADPPLPTRQRYVATILEIREAQGEPERAGRDLSRLAEEGMGTLTGMWAQGELARLRRLRAGEEENEGPVGTLT